MPLPIKIHRSSLASQKKRRRVLLAQTWWEDRVLKGVVDYATEHNWELDCRMKWTHRLPSQHWERDGIIVKIGASPLLRLAARPLVRYVRNARIPVVDMQQLSDVFDAPKVLVPEEQIGRLAGEHFVALGFRAMGYVSMQDNVLERARSAGFRKAVEAAGAVFHAFTPKTLARQLPKLPGAMAFFAVNDLNALQVIRMCLDAGRRVPEEFAVLGADDTDILCDHAVVPLSSVICDFERQGYEAASLLDRLMNGEAAPEEPVIIAPKGVHVRCSTDIVAIPDLDAARMLRFLRDHHRETFSLPEAAKAISVPLRRVRIAFRKYLGHSMLQELVRLRVEDAKRRLVDKSTKLETVAVECGFSNRFHFIQAFRRMTGMSPRAYRATLADAKIADSTALAEVSGRRRRE